MMPSQNKSVQLTTFGLLVTALCLLGAGCDFDVSNLPGLGEKNKSVKAEPEIEAERKSMQVAVGQMFTIEFEGNQTTGYRWTADYSRPDIEFVKDEYVPHDWEAPPNMDAASAPNGRVGVGGTHHFTFGAVRPSHSQIKFEYVRPWEPDKPLKVVIYDIKAR